jgi:hypothetical protein
MSLLMSCMAALPALAGDEAHADIIQNVESVVAVRDPATTPDFPLGSVMRSDCDLVVWITAEDGSGTEYLVCQVNDEPVMIPENQGTPPTETVHYTSGECVWTSDYWFARDESIVMAASVEVTVTPAGRVFAIANYPADPIECPDEEPEASGSPAPQESPSAS